MTLDRSTSYIYDYLTFLFIDKKAQDTIRAVYLFGSAVRGELRPDSDIDVFIDCSPKHEAQVKRMAEGAAAAFARSKDYEKWKLFDFRHPFSFQTGRLSEWELKASIESEGIQLYGKPSIEGYDRAALFTVELPKRHRTYLRLSRVLFGRHEKGFASKGLVEQCGGQRLGASVFFVPLAKRKEVLDYLAKNKLAYRLQDIAVRE